jgi:hypothetical protein
MKEKRTRPCMACKGTGKQPLTPPFKYTPAQLAENARKCEESWARVARHFGDRPRGVSHG